MIGSSVTSILSQPPRIALPRRPEKAPPRSFPMLATASPVLASLALWVITQSPFALVFAALGPIIAVASIGDARLQARGLHRREALRFSAECTAAIDAIAHEHSRERRERDALHPGARALLEPGAHAPELWRHSFGAPLLVRLGSAELPSVLELQGEAASTTASTAASTATSPAAAGDATEARLREVQKAGAVLADAPVVVDARFGIGIVGPALLALPAARAVVLQLAAMLPPAETELLVQGRLVDSLAEHPWQWLESLPHRWAAPQTGGGIRSTVVLPTVVFSSSSAPDSGRSVGSVVVAIAPTLAELPREARIVVRVGDGHGGDRRGISGHGDDRQGTLSAGALLRHPEQGWRGELRPDYVSLDQATLWATAQQQRARAEGVLSAQATLPVSVPLRELLQPVQASAATVGLECVLGVGDDGPFRLDLAAQGPHAVVGGTTGSGKSELLVTWVLGMAATRPPAVVTFLFVDFKGGASFEPLRALPHCVGVITDLDGQEALRALGSLRAEIRYRERSLAAAGFRSLDHAPSGTPFPRLVLVVDEYAAMVDEHPELHPLFSDLAARGRSLGIHLILCTQRPAGVLREGVLANCALRVSLKVNNRADSIAVIGTDAAATREAGPLGRAFVSAGGEPPRALQVALANDDDAQAVAQQWPTTGQSPRRPWCPPLPAVVQSTDLGLLGESGEGEGGGGGVPFALADLPDEQRQAAARFLPATDGHLLVVGGSGSGKSGTLSALAAAASAFSVVRAPAEVDVVWDSLREALEHQGAAMLLLLDDVDALVASCGEDHSSALVDLLGRVLREGPARGVHLVLTMQRVPGQLQSLTALCGSRLILRMPSRQEHVLVGGDAAVYVPELPPGAGYWRGGRVQVVLAPPATVSTGTVPPSSGDRRDVDLTGLDEGRALVAVSTRPAVFAGRLRSAHPSRQVIELSPLGADPRQLLVSTGGCQPILVGDPETWQSHWGAIGALRASADLVFDGCSVAELRQLTRVRELPPPHAPSVRPLWVLTPEGRLARATLGPA